MIKNNLKTTILLTFIFLAANFAFAEEDADLSIDTSAEIKGNDYKSRKGASASGDFWISPLGETVMYSSSGNSFGGGLALGYGKGASIGLKTAYFVDTQEEIDVLEVGVLLRFYIRGSDFCSGPFVQFNGGQALFFRRENISIPAKWGIISAGVNLGWRFHLGKLFFVEPSIRAGYPYFAGAGLMAGVHW